MQFLTYRQRHTPRLTGGISVEERHASLHQISEHDVVEIDAGIHANLHEEEAAE